MTINIVGNKYGKLTVLEILKSKKTQSGKSIGQVKCKCDCGTVKIINKPALKAGKIKSCGCFKKAMLSKNSPAIKHNLAYTDIYKVWKNIKQRCLNPKCKAYKNYGARGIKIHKDWKNDPEAFINYIENNLGSKPSKQHTLDRINNKSGNYEPGNLKWSSKSEQQRNRRGCLTRDQVLEIKNLLKSGITQQKIADQFKVSKGTITKINLGQRYADVN